MKKGSVVSNLPSSVYDDWAMRYDRVCFARAACPGYTFDAWQERALESNHPRLLFNIHRQGGKSLICAIIALHTALYECESPVLCVSPSLRQSSELFRVVLGLYRTLDKPVAPDVENKLSLGLRNGSRILSLPGSEATIRGISKVRAAIVDEGARCPSELIAAIRPMLATTNGRLISPSTPNGRMGWWYEEWEHGGDTWERYQVRADECKRISASFLAEERRALGPSVFAREYECSFDDNDLSVFSEELIQRVISTEYSSWSEKIPKANWQQIAEAAAL